MKRNEKKIEAKWINDPRCHSIYGNELLMSANQMVLRVFFFSSLA